MATIKKEECPVQGSSFEYNGKTYDCSRAIKRDDDGFFYADFEHGNTIDSADIIPATKEQRDILMNAMVDAGYTFDFEKKELQKIENKNPLLSDFFKAEYERGKTDGQKLAAWSDEDEVKINRIVSCLENLNVADNDILLKDVDWLKSLRPQKQWKPSEEQMKALNYVVNLMASSESLKENDYYYNVFKDLRKQLKAL